MNAWLVAAASVLTMVGCAARVAWSNGGRHPAWAPFLLTASLVLKSYR